MQKASITALQKRVRQLGNHEIARHHQGFFKTGKGEYGEGDRFIGIRVPVLRKLASQQKDMSLEAASNLLGSEFHEERQLSLLILVSLFNKGTQKEKHAVYKVYLENTRFINNWDLVDCSAQHIIGAYLFTHNRKPIYRLARSKLLWERRISIMSTFYFIIRNEFDDTLNLSEKLKYDPEDLIHKAVGWMLREIGNRNLVIEEMFLKTHYQDMPRTMLRYAIEKLPEKKRKAYLKGKIKAGK
ncbi:MAG: DNA alkylation repair protein [Desulfobacterales bacterium]|nr:DNA alkylation repair protein [Desulfobacterales bacterium]MDX2510693.1 DNA alkylation repair protein [Desulfobacterales bacterium]